MKISALILLVITLVCIDLASSKSGPAPNAPLMEGKVKTNRTVQLDKSVDASPATVFRLWTSADGIKRFFAPEAKIDAKIGGRYQVIFFPAKDPEGESHGTKGARILDLVPNEKLVFEWITFAGDNLLGSHAPPYAPPAERNESPLPTWVELSFEPVADEPNKTHVKFAHYGFRDGEKWEQSYQWFTRAWAGVLDELASYCRKQKQQRIGNEAANASRSVVDIGKF
jgi:uncharacterized protein YndB with AHSA1/START domain